MTTAAQLPVATRTTAQETGVECTASLVATTGFWLAWLCQRPGLQSQAHGSLGSLSSVSPSLLTFRETDALNSPASYCVGQRRHLFSCGCLLICRLKGIERKVLSLCHIAAISQI